MKRRSTPHALCSRIIYTPKFIRSSNSPFYSRSHVVVCSLLLLRRIGQFGDGLRLQVLVAFALGRQLNVALLLFARLDFAHLCLADLQARLVGGAVQNAGAQECVPGQLYYLLYIQTER